MIVRNLDDVIGTERDVDWGQGRSRRLLLKRDKMGFSLHDTTIKAGSIVNLEYKNHLEAVYYISGEGEVEYDNGKVCAIKPFTLFAMNEHDKHIVKAKTDLRCVCVFNPPLKGDENHRQTFGGKDGNSGY